MARKNKLFSGNITEYQKLWNDLNWINILLSRRGLPPVQPFSHRKEDLQSAIEAAEEQLAQPVEQPEPEPWEDEPEDYEPEEPEEPEPPPQPEQVAEDDELQRKKDAVLEAIGTDGTTKDIITAIMECLCPDEQDVLRIYPSEDILKIAGLFATNPGISMEEAERRFEAQRKKAFEEMKEEEEEEDGAGWDKIDPF